MHATTHFVAVALRPGSKPLWKSGGDSGARAWAWRWDQPYYYFNEADLGECVTSAARARAHIAPSLAPRERKPEHVKHEQFSSPRSRAQMQLFSFLLPIAKYFIVSGGETSEDVARRAAICRWGGEGALDDVCR